LNEHLIGIEFCKTLFLGKRRRRKTEKKEKIKKEKVVKEDWVHCLTQIGGYFTF
jgi:hypothetical protein